MMKTLATAALVAAAGLGFAATAHAFTPQEDVMIQTMDAAGYHYANIPKMLDNAHVVCGRIAAGSTPNQVKGQLVMELGIDLPEAELFVNTAQANLC